MPTYKTPGVYTEEISKFPPSVAEVATAIPAFIGYTEEGGTLPAEPHQRAPEMIAARDTA